MRNPSDAGSSPSTANHEFSEGRTALVATREATLHAQKEHRNRHSNVALEKTAQAWCDRSGVPTPLEAAAAPRPHRLEQVRGVSLRPPSLLIRRCQNCTHAIAAAKQFAQGIKLTIPQLVYSTLILRACCACNIFVISVLQQAEEHRTPAELTKP